MRNNTFKDWRFVTDMMVCENIISEDYEFSMARSELKTAQDAINRLLKKLKGEGELEAWVQSKITKAADYIDSVADHLDSGESETIFKEQLKPHKTIEQIAKKHKVDVSFIKNQLKIGSVVEKEHTKDKTLAIDIALQHLDEIPDYYTKLKKMESFSKKDYKKNDSKIKESTTIEDANGNTFLEVIDVISATPLKSTVKEQSEEERYCTLCKKNETKSSCSYGPKMWEKFSIARVHPANENRIFNYKKNVKEHCGCEDDIVKDFEKKLKKIKNTSYNSIDILMNSISDQYDISTKKLHDLFVEKNKKTPDEWIKNLREETKSGDDSLHDWFSKSKSKDGKPGWVQLGGPYAGKPCARQPGQKSTPKCGSSKMAKNLSAKEEKAAFNRKNRQDPDQPQKTGGAKPTYVKTEEAILEKKDACYHKVKSRYKIWPSAYASGALVKCRKKGAKNWGTKTESFSEEYTRIQTNGKIYSIMTLWRGKSIYTQLFFPQFPKPTRDQVSFEINKIYPGAKLISFVETVRDPNKPLLFVGEKNEYQSR